MHKLRKWPSEYDRLPKWEKAFVIAAVQLKLEADKKAEKEAERKAKASKGKKGKRKR